MDCAFRVSAAEAGQKLLQCLARRVGETPATLHRWIRTGQVRVNGGRRKAFDRLNAGDEVRLPPFAVPAGTAARAAADAGKDAAGKDGAANVAGAEPGADLPGLPGLAVVFASETLLVLNKPAGLPTQPGTGHDDSVVTRLRARFAGASFAPTPAHRLDRDTSGLLLIARSYAALRQISGALARHDGSVRKEYLAWCVGAWRQTGVTRLTDTLIKQADASGRVRVRALPDGAPGQAAALDVRPLLTRGGATLLQIRLLTGRTHQIRAQLAARGFPLAGDGKYGGRAAYAGLAPLPGLLLHACRLTLGTDCFEALPPWDGAWQVTSLPPPFADKSV